MTQSVVPSEDTGFLEALRRHWRFVDGVLLLLVPLGIAIVFVQPTGEKLGLTLVYTDPSLITGFTAHFVHLTTTHLVVNLLGFVIIGGLGYIFCVLSGHRTKFLVVLATFLLAFPLVLSALNVALVRPSYGYGFSAVVMAFLGFLPIALVWFLEARFTARISIDAAPAFYYFGVAVIAAIAVPLRPLTIGLAAVAILIGSYETWTLATDLTDDDVLGAVRSVGYSEAALLGILVYFLFLVIAFPPTVARDGHLVNIYSHFLGFCLGFIVPYVTFRGLEFVTQPDTRTGPTARDTGTST